MAYAYPDAVSQLGKGVAVERGGTRTSTAGRRRECSIVLRLPWLKPRQDPVGAFGNLGEAHPSGDKVDNWMQPSRAGVQ
jgi:hypothetical protein